LEVQAKEYCSVELYAYLEGVNKKRIPFQDEETNEVLNLVVYWDRMKSNFPVLYRMSLDFCAIQGNW
jgi:hypothetical protein